MKTTPIKGSVPELVLNKIITAVNTYSGIDLRGKSQEREVLKVRAIYYKFCLEYTVYSQALIAGAINKDHSTVTHHKANIDNEYYFDETCDTLYEIIKENLFTDEESFREFTKAKVVHKTVEEKELYLANEIKLLKEEVKGYKSKVNKLRAKNHKLKQQNSSYESDIRTLTRGSD